LGSAFSIGGTAGDFELVLGSGSDAWAVQNVSVTGRQQLTLSFEAAALNDATGGVTLEFSDASGNVLGSTYLDIAGNGADYQMSVVAPDGAVSGRIVAWTGSGAGIAIDDFSLRAPDAELIANGGFEYVGTLADEPAAHDFVPMIWGAADMKYVRTPGVLDGADTLLTFNEPNHDGQANLTVNQALSYWPELMATGLRLGSPAATTSSTLGQGAWLHSFMSQADAEAYRVDFITVHYYSTDPSIAKFKAFLEDVYAAYQRPIWVTEWALADWNQPDRFSAEQQMAFFKAGTLMMDDLAFVERQAWFGTYEKLDTSQLNSQLIDADGSHSLVGSIFASLAGVPEIPKQIQIQVHEGTSGNDLFVALQADDWIVNGHAGDDSITTLGGADTINGGTGNDVIVAGSGNDTISVGSGEGFDAIDGGAGDDTIVALANGTTIGLTSIAGIETISANGFANTRISGGDGADTLDFSNTALNGITRIGGGAGDDVIVGSAGNDVISGDAGKDTLWGGAGDDTFLMSSTSRTDTIDGGDGYDTIKATQSSSVLYWANVIGVEAVCGKGYGAVDILGSTGSDTIDLSLIALTGIRQIDGRDGNDTIIGSAGADRITGGNGSDHLAGGAGNDVFDFNTIGQSKVGHADVISDFVVGTDVIDLSTIDASTATAGNQAFLFIGEDALTGVAGQLRIDTSQAGRTTILGDVNGNKVVDFQIELVGAYTLTGSDFVL
jgi:Ca2+-binding RTX toxin-like protein